MPTEPKVRTIHRSNIPPATKLNLPKGYWDAQVRHLALLGPSEVLEFFIERGDHYAQGIRSSLHCAAAKAGARVSILIRGPRVFAWLAGKRPAPTRACQPRQPIRCAVCGREVERPKWGGSRQFVCAGSLRRKSPCQNLRRLAQIKGITIEEAKQRSKAWRG